MTKMEKSNVLVVWMPSDQIGDDRAYRDYVLESLRTGVLVLPSEVTCEVMELPPLGGVEVISTGDKPLVVELEPQSTQDEVFRAQDQPQSAFQDGAAEKRAILQRLQVYRNVNGRGCLAAVAKASRTRGKINDNTLRMILTGDTQFPIEDWRKIGRALDRLEAKEVPVDG